MISGIPAKRVPLGWNPKLVNVDAYGVCARIAPGSKVFGARRHFPFTADDGADTLTVTGHPWVTGDLVYCTTSDTLPDPLAESIGYYVIYVDANTIQVATTYANAIAGAAIDLIDTGTGTHRVGYGAVNGREQNHAQNMLVFMFGARVYVSDLRMSEYISVLNISDTYPSGVSMIAEEGDNMIVASNSGIFRVVLDDDFYYMYPINDAPPIVLVTDVNEDVAAGLVFGYRYTYGHAIITSTGNRDRHTSGAELVHESGTCFVPGGERDYGEVFFDSAISDDAADPHTIGDLTLSDAVNHATHFPLYRTKNIGENSGGISPTTGIGNRLDRMCWCADVPVAKAFNINDPGGGVVLTIPDGNNNTVLGEIGNEIELRDLLGGATFTRNITSVDTAARTITVDGAGINGAHVAAIGHGRVFRASQAGVIITIDQPAAGVFLATDKGKPIFRADGGIAYIAEYISATQARAAVSETWSNLGCTMKPAAGNFYRKWNDTVLDDGAGVGKIDLNDRILSGKSLYIPRRFHREIPNGNLVATAPGFMIAGQRDEVVYRYSATGDKPWCAGYYLPVVQQFELKSTMRHFVLFPSMLVIPCAKCTYTLALNVTVDAGKTEIGESIPALKEPILVDSFTGVTAWGSITFKGESLILAVTSEPALRSFDGHSWSKQNFAIDQRTGFDAVQKDYFNRMDLYYGVIGSYVPLGGLKLWFKRWIDA
jgi:hypothetical protein